MNIQNAGIGFFRIHVDRCHDPAVDADPVGVGIGDILRFGNIDILKALFVEVGQLADAAAGCTEVEFLQLAFPHSYKEQAVTMKVKALKSYFAVVDDLWSTAPSVGFFDAAAEENRFCPHQGIIDKLFITDDKVEAITQR